MRHWSSFPWQPRQAGCFALVLAATAVSGVVPAQTPPALAGRWQASPLRSVWTVGEWDAACGPRPSGGDLPGEFVTIRQAHGELSISGERSISTAGCSHGGGDLTLSQHTAGSRHWSSVCKSSDTSERHVVLRTTVNATDNAIQFDESGQYQFLARGHSCTASSRRTRQYELVERWALTDDPAGSVSAPAAAPDTVAASAPSAAMPLAAEAADTPVERCHELGPATNIELQPNQKLLAPGQSATFEVSVRDDAGCSLPTSSVSFELEPPSNGLSWTQQGVLSAAGDAAESETEFVARAGAASARARVSLVSASRYEELLGPSQLRNVAISAPASPGDPMPASLGAATAVAENRASTRKFWFGAFVGLTAAALGALGLVLLRQARLRPPLTLPSSPPPLAPAIVGPELAKICPTCGLMYGSEAQFCGKDGSYLVQAN